MRFKNVVLTLALLLATTCAFADVPSMINYQGKLLTPAGASVADTACVMQFAIYDAPTGGTLLWTETNNSVQVKKGLFSVLLGGTSPLGPNLFNTPNRFLGVKVGADAEMTPRQQIVSSAFAFKAATADMASTAVNALMANTVPDGSITGAKIAANAGIPISKTELGIYTAWSNWMPVLQNISGAGDPTTIKCEYYCRYCQIGKTIFFRLTCHISDTAGVTGCVGFSLPVPAGSQMGGDAMVSGWIAAKGSNPITTCKAAPIISTIGVAGNASGLYFVNGCNTSPIWWNNLAPDDFINVQGFYEVD